MIPTDSRVHPCPRRKRIEASFAGASISRVDLDPVPFSNHPNLGCTIIQAELEGRYVGLVWEGTRLNILVFAMGSGERQNKNRTLVPTTVIAVNSLDELLKL